ncbi:hypothetical protein IFM89_019496 [Coptis chinensis]|uniref:Uncharacterized protein n=1 Tax=Coptis chinensis TaxID=261450 RepID=A0A835LC94_9MAGN|nr:hypothetical protein IFM89_019496 [Coptis chinensis]
MALSPDDSGSKVGHHFAAKLIISKVVLCVKASLMQLLPFKKGLSEHYQGKSQSFTSVSNARSLEDLARLDDSCKKKTENIQISKQKGAVAPKQTHIRKGTYSNGKIVRGMRRKAAVKDRSPLNLLFTAAASLKPLKTSLPKPCFSTGLLI